MTQSFIITGGTGFIGRKVVEQLLREKYDITLICRDIKKAQLLFERNDIKFIEHDLVSNEELEVECTGSTLIHLAWSTLDSYHSELHLTKHLPNHIKFLESMVRRGIQTLIIAGTCFEYGIVEGEIPPTKNAAPVCNYAKAKHMLHMHMRQIQDRYPYCLHWTRIFYAYGRGESSKTLLGQLNSAIKNKEATFNMSKGDQIRDFINVYDVAEQLIQLTNNKQSSIANICSGKPRTVNQIVNEYLKKHEAKIELNRGYYDYNSYEPMNFWGQPGTARQ